MTLEVISPGGRSDYDGTKKFDEGFGGGLNSLLAPADTGASSFGITTNLQGGGAIAGLGDDAFRGFGNTVYTVKGDTELDVQVIDLEDSGAAQMPIDLLQVALSHL